MESTTTPVNTKVGFWEEFLKLLAIAVLVVIPFRLFIAQPFVVDGASMVPTFENGQYLVVDELTYHFRGPERGSVLIFKYPKDPKKYFIKRVIGLPNEKVVIEDGKVTIINSNNPQGFTLEEEYVTFPKEDTASYELRDDEYFVLGDNREGSADSRFWGPLPEKNIIGRPIFRLWPLSIWPGDVKEYTNEKS